MSIRFLRNKDILLFLIYIMVLVFFAAFSYQIIFHDTWEYIPVAKKLAGFWNFSAFAVHSLVYPFFISFFIRFFPSIFVVKLVNISWIILTGLLLYISGSKKISFLMWIFSPITWITSIVISPFLPASFFLLVAYLSIKKWQENKRNLHFIISALALGLSAAFCDLCVILIAFFILSFFYDKKLKKVIFYSSFTFISFSTRLILDASLFSLAINDKLIPFPIYSLIRWFGARLIIQLGLHPEITTTKLFFTNLEFWSFLILISPLLFYLYRINYQKNKNIILFLILSTGLFLFQGGSHLYFIILAPLTIILLSKTFRKKELFLHIILSSLIIIIMTYPYFIHDKQEIEKRKLVIDDLKTINKDFSFDTAVFYTSTLANFYLWDKSLPYFISIEDYNKILQKDDYYTHYTFEVKPKIDTQKILELKAGLKTHIKEDIDYENLPLLLEKEEIPPEGYKLTKCYTILCVYEKA